MYSEIAFDKCGYKRVLSWPWKRNTQKIGFLIGLVDFLTNFWKIKTLTIMDSDLIEINLKKISIFWNCFWQKWVCDNVHLVLQHKFSIKRFCHRVLQNFEKIKFLQLRRKFSYSEIAFDTTKCKVVLMWALKNWEYQH